jgi:hypothetical protein
MAGGIHARGRCGRSTLAAGTFSHNGRPGRVRTARPPTGFLGTLSLALAVSLSAREVGTGEACATAFRAVVPAVAIFREMRFLLLLPVVLSLLALAAHFLRAGNLLMVLVCLGSLALLAVRRVWARRVVQALLMIGVLVWVQVMAARVAERQARGESWQRLAIILGAVASVAGLSIAALETRRMRAHFAPDRPGS